MKEEKGEMALVNHSLVKQKKKNDDCVSTHKPSKTQNEKESQLLDLFICICNGVLILEDC